MKTRIVLISAITMAIFGTVFFLYSLSSYDFAPSTKENPYGVTARVLIQPTYFSPPIPPKDPIEPQDVLWFRYHSQEPIQLVGYNICNGMMCIKSEIQSYSPHDPANLDKPQKWTGGTIGDLPWNEGDAVHIRVKIKPVTISEDGTIIPQDDKFTFIDLGKSKIIKSTSETTGDGK